MRYDLPNRTLETTYPSGRKELLHKCDVLEFLEGQLTGLELSAGGAELPFDFRGGFVGYLGYELKELVQNKLPKVLDKGSASLSYVPSLRH